MKIDLAELGLTEEITASILAAGTAKATTPEKKSRARITDAAWAAAKAGLMPPALTFPASNVYAQKHADKLRELGEAQDLVGLGNYHIGGTNTYSKALRSYRDAMVAYVQTALPPFPLRTGAKKAGGSGKGSGKAVQRKAA